MNQQSRKFLEILKKNNVTNNILIISNSLTSAISWPMCLGVSVHWFCDFSAEYLVLHKTEQVPGSVGNFNTSTDTIVEHFGVTGSQRSAQFVYMFAFLHFLIFLPFLTFRSKQSSVAYFKTHWQLIVIVLAMILGKNLSAIFCSIVLLYININDYLHEKGLNF